MVEADPYADYIEQARVVIDFEEARGIAEWKHGIIEGLRPALDAVSAYTFVGDAKYKRIGDGAVPNADVYQILAYATALDLPGGLLVYAKGEADHADYEVVHSCKRLEVTTIDLAGSISEILTTVDRLAQRVRSLQEETRGQPLAA